MTTKIKSNIYLSNNLKVILQGYIDHFVESTCRVDSSRASDELGNHLTKLIETRGIKETLKWIKRARLHVTKFIAGEPLMETEGVEINPMGLPKSLLSMVTLVKDLDPKRLQVALTLLTITRSILLQPNPDTKPITDTWGGKIPENWNANRSAIFRRLKISRRGCFWKNFHISTKSGPNGQAIMNSMNDFRALEETSQLDDITLFAGKELKDVMDRLVDYSNMPQAYEILGKCTYKWHEKPISRKITAISDVEGKTRLIGVIDYWTQTALKPLHDHINTILLKIKEDCTFDQSSFFTKLPKNGPYYSFDLTNATERLPIALQKEIIRQIVGDERADAGERILIKEGFHLGTEKIHYGTGQPMGAFSSGPAMAITHHAIVHLAGLDIKVKPNGKYVVLGDDIVIAHPQLATRYQEIMAILDVPISKMKTHVSIDTFEFAKRWVHKGIEITPFPIPGVLNTGKRYYLLQNVMETAKTRGFEIGPEKEEIALLDILDRLGKRSQKDRYIKLYKIFDMMVSKKGTLKDRMGLLYKYISATGSIDTSSKLQVNEENFEEMYKALIYQHTQAELRNTSYEITGLVKGLEEYKIYDGKAKNKGDSTLSNVTFDLLKPLHPIFYYSSRIREVMDPLVKEINLLIDDQQPLDQLAKLLIRFPRLSLKILSTRNFHKVLSSQARLVKGVISLVRNDSKTLEEQFNVYLVEETY